MSKPLCIKMGVSCEIYVEKPSKGVHRVGQPVTGILRYAVKKPTEYQTAIISLIGKAECRWIVRSHNAALTYTGRETFTSLHLNILDKEQEETMILPAGKYEFRFRFILPSDVPPSYQDNNSCIEYHLSVLFDKPRLFYSTTKFDKTITIYGNPTPPDPIRPILYERRRVLYKMFSCKKHTVVIKAQITKWFLLPGSQAEVQLTVINDTDTTIDYVSTKLVNTTKYHSTGFLKDTMVVKNKFRSSMIVTPPVAKNQVFKSTCLIPIMPELYSLQHCKIIENEFFIRVIASLGFPHINISLNIPIVIGDGRFGDFSGIELGNSNETNDGSGIVDSASSSS